MSASRPSLSRRALNRALLARQGLLERSAEPAADMVERLAGLQAQVPENPYVALWSRLEGFEPGELSRLIEQRRAVRAQLMRATIHLVSASDCLAFQPVTLSVLERTFASPWRGRLGKLGGGQIDEIVAAGVKLLREQPRTRAQLAELLAPRWPEADPAALAHAVTFHAPLVQVPPRGLWGGRGQATWAPTEHWLGRELPADASADAMVLRYLAAFGPASTADIRTWSGLTGLREVVERLRPDLRSFTDERGRELLDVADGPLPDPETPAPPRFLPEYDNVLLSHDDRSRVLGEHSPGGPLSRGGSVGTLLVDGFHRAYWGVVGRGGSATLTVHRLGPLPGDPKTVAGEIAAEGARLLELLSGGASGGEVRFEP